MPRAVNLHKAHLTALTDHLYVKPWVGLGYMFTAQDVVIDGETFERSAFRPFPAVNVGWRF